MKHYPTMFFTLVLVICVAFSTAAYAGSGERFEADLSGGQEVVFDVSEMIVPGGRDTPAEGSISVKFDKLLTMVEVNLKIDNLLGAFTAAHFHCGRAGQNGPVVFGLVSPGPLDFDGRRIKGTLTNLDFNGADCVPVIGRPVNNIAALAFAMKEGLIYINVHSSSFPPGELRGQMLER